jgi:hypothetical protein
MNAQSGRTISLHTRLDIRLRKIRSLKTTVSVGKPLKTAPVAARAVEAKPLGTAADRRP